MQEAAVPLSRDNLVINELMREYLLFNGYRNTLSVLLPGDQHLCYQQNMLSAGTSHDMPFYKTKR